MERLKLRYQDARRALSTFEEILAEPFSVIVRDAAVQRFEYTFEAVWKFIKQCFKQPRRTLRNNLAQTDFDKSLFPEEILKLRAQQMNFEQLLDVWKSLQESLK